MNLTIKNEFLNSHDDKLIYFDNAATTIKKPDCVVEAVCHALTSMGNSGRALHSGALDASRMVYATREKIANFFGCTKAKNVVFTSNATEALNIAIFGMFKAGDHIISTDLDHNSVLRPLYALQRNKSVEVDFLRADKFGNINYNDLSKLLKRNTKAIVCPHASNLTGNVLDIKKIGEFAKQHGLYFVLDAAQTAGVFPIDMKSVGISILCFTGHKSLLGPQGTGGLCIEGDVDISPLKFGGTGVQTFLEEQPFSLPTKLEAGTLNSHGIAGLFVGISYIEQIGLDVIRKKEQNLMWQFYNGISAIDGIEIYGDFTQKDRAPIVSLNSSRIAASELADILSGKYNIATRAGAHCAPRMHRALGTEKLGAVRFSFCYDNTENEVEYAIEVLRKICL